MRNEYDFSKGKRGALITEAGKEHITIRLDAAVMAWFRQQVKGGGNDQTLINEALKAHIGMASKNDAPLTVRKLREVLRQALRME